MFTRKKESQWNLWVKQVDTLPLLHLLKTLSKYCIKYIKQKESHNYIVDTLKSYFIHLYIIDIIFKHIPCLYMCMFRIKGFPYLCLLSLSLSSSLLFFSLSKALSFVFIDVVLHFFIEVFTRKKESSIFNSFICSEKLRRK